jgi:hypothetical protein
MIEFRKDQKDGFRSRDGEVPGIVIADGRLGSILGDTPPRIAAFIWGGKVRPAPTLPFGRWKGAA